MNLNSLSGIYLNQIFFGVRVNGRSLYERLLAKNNNDQIAAREQLGQFVLQNNPDLFNYSDDVVRELIDPANNQNYTQTAEYLNSLADQLHLRGDGEQPLFSSNSVQQIMANPSFQVLDRQVVNAENKNGYFYATLFDRHPMFLMDDNGQPKLDANGNRQLSPVFNTYFWMNAQYAQNGHPQWDVNGNMIKPSQMMVDQQGRVAPSNNWNQFNRIDAGNSVAGLPRIFRLPTSSGTFINSVDYVRSMRPVSPELMQIYQQRLQAMGAAMSPAQVELMQSQPIAYPQSQAVVQNSTVPEPVASSQPALAQPANNQSTAPINNAQPQGQPVQGQPEQNNPVPQQDGNGQLRAANAMFNARQPMPMGDFPRGQISRDDVLEVPYYYVASLEGGMSGEAAALQNHRRTVLDSNWNHNNGKYFWRSALTANNSPVTVDEMMKALSPYFSTNNMEEQFRSLLTDSEGTDDSMVVTVQPKIIMQGSGDSFDDYYNVLRQQNAARYSMKAARNQELRDAGLKNKDVQVIEHDGHQFSPSDVSKVQFILQVAQDAGLDYDIQSNGNGQIYLKVNDNRGMRVTLFDVDDPSNIGATRDRSGNEYQVDWRNVKVGPDAQHSRPVYSYLTREGRVNTQARTNNRYVDARHFDLSSNMVSRYDASKQMGTDEINDLKRAYMNTQSDMPADVRSEITKALNEEHFDGNNLSDEIFTKAVSKAVQRDGMRTYKSLPEDYQKFMAAVPMIEALGIDTQRLNGFQELADKYGYTSDNLVTYDSSHRIARLITPTTGDVQLETQPIYNPDTQRYEKRSGFGIGQTDQLTSVTDNAVAMRDSRFNNSTNMASDYAMSTRKADHQMAINFQNARIGILRSINREKANDNDLAMSKVVTNYENFVADFAKSHHMDLGNEADQKLLSTTYAYVTQAVQHGKIVDGRVNEDFQNDVLVHLENQLDGDRLDNAKDFAKQLYRFVNNETGTAILWVNDGYDRSPEHLQELANADTDDAKEELKNINWYEEYGYHTGDQRHYYLDTIEEFTAGSQANAIQYSFDLINAAKQTSEELEDSFIAHDPVQSKVIQQRMVKFDSSHQVYMSQLSQPLNANRFDSDEAFNDWVLEEFNNYMAETNQKVDLAHLNEQYQGWLNQLQTDDVTDLASYNPDERVVLSAQAKALVNEDGEIIHRLPENVPADWNKYFVDGQLMNPESQSKERFDILSQVQDSLTSSGIMVDYVDLATGQPVDRQTWIDDYKKQHADLSNEQLDDAFNNQIASGRFTPDIAIDQNGLVHWRGHSVIANSQQDAAEVMRHIKDMRSDQASLRANGEAAIQDMIRVNQVSLSPVEGQLGQFFVPDRRNMIHTNYYVFPSLKANMTPEQQFALQDDQIAGYKAVIQAQREINQRGDINPEDFKNFNDRLILSSTPQVIKREIQENIRMQTAQMPVANNLVKPTALGLTLQSMSNMVDQYPSSRAGVLGIPDGDAQTPVRFGGPISAVQRDATGRMRRVRQPFSKDVLQQQMSRWYTNILLPNQEVNRDVLNALSGKVQYNAQTAQVAWDPEFMDEVFNHIDPDNNANYGIIFSDDVRIRRDYTRPEDTTIVNKVYGQETASTKMIREDQFDAKNPDDYASQETLNRALTQMHHRMRINNGVGEATNTAQIINDMSNIEDAVQEWMELHPNEAPFSTPNFEYEIKNRVHSRVQALGGANIGMLADDQSLGYIDMLSTGQGKVQGLVRVLADNAKVGEDGHVTPAMVPVPMTNAELEAYQKGENDFQVMHVTAPDPDDPSKMKQYTYKMSRYLDGNALTKDSMFKYLSKLPFDRAFIAVEQAAKANYVDKDATLALMNANIMNMEDGSVVSKHFAETHLVIGADGELRPLMTGDKLSDTSGDKTTIAMVVDPDMSLEEAQKQDIVDIVQFMKRTNVDIIKSPLSQISRKNMSQVMDMIDSYAEYNPDGTVKIHIPLQVDEDFTDANGHTYHKGDLLPAFDDNNRPIHREPSDEEKEVGFNDLTGNPVKPILRPDADHRKSLADLKKEDANWIKFMQEGGPAAFKNGKHFVDVDGKEQYSWPQQVFEHTVSRDQDGTIRVGYTPALEYQMDPNPIETNCTIGNVTAFVTNILADDKVNNYGIDPDASTEGRKYSDLVANADAERNAYKLTQFLTSTDSSALPEFREYLKVLGYEMSPDGTVFSTPTKDVIHGVKQDYLTRASQVPGNLVQGAQDLNSAAQALNMTPEEFNDAYADILKDFNVPKLDTLQNPDQWKLAAAQVKAMQIFDRSMDKYLEAKSHPGEIRDHFTIDQLGNNSASEDPVMNAILDANSKVSSMNGTQMTWDLVSPFPVGVGLADQGIAGATLNHHHRVYDPKQITPSYEDQIMNAMNNGQMQRFGSVDEAMTLYNRPSMPNPNKQKPVQATSMRINNQWGAMSQEQLTAIAPMLQRIGLNVDDLKPGFKNGLLGANRNVAVPDLNGVRKKFQDGRSVSETLQQMDAGSAFMEMIDGSDGGELELPDGMTVRTLGDQYSHTISILPQSMRRSRRSQSNNQTTVDDYTRDYAQIGVGLKRYQVAVKALEMTMPKYSENVFVNKDVYQQYLQQREVYLKAAKKQIWDRSGVQDAVNRINDRVVSSVFGKNSAGIKTNFIRQRLMSNRVKSSSTAVQTNGYNLPIDTIEVSPDILKSLGMRIGPDGYAYSPNPDNPQDRSWDMVHVHRDPVWRSHGSLGFRIKVNNSIAGVRVSPVTVSLMDGDFDGDTIGLIAVADKGGQEDLHDSVNVLANIYDQKDKAKLGSSDLNVSAELVDLAGRSQFNMDMAKAFGGRMPAHILKMTGTTDKDWQFGPIMNKVQDENGNAKLVLNTDAAQRVMQMAQKLYPNDSSLRKDPSKLNVKKVLKTYYSLGLDVGTKELDHLADPRFAAGQLQPPKDGKLGWSDPKNILATFVNNTDKAIRTENPRRLEMAGVNCENNREDDLDKRVEKAKQSYAAYIERGAKGSPSALHEMFSENYLKNQPLYDPEMMSYADAVHVFQDQMAQLHPEAIGKDEKGNVTLALDKIQDPEERQNMADRFNQIHDRFLKPENRQMFINNKKNIDKQLGLLSTVMDATKEKSDLTGQPGGWQKKLAAALADKGPQGLVLANAIGYVMTQATLQVKHDPVLAHKLADIEVNGMSSIYGGNYEERSLMLGLVGNHAVKSGPDLIVPLGKNTFVAGVNQSMLKRQVDAWKQTPGFLNHFGIDLRQQDFSFHALTQSKQGLDLLHQLRDNLVDFNPTKGDGTTLTDQELAEGFDQATRPMFSRWDPETGKQLDLDPETGKEIVGLHDKTKNLHDNRWESFKDKLGHYQTRITPDELAANIDRMAEKSNVTLPVKIQPMVQMLLDNEKHVRSLVNVQKEDAGVLMSAKMEGIKPISKQADQNTECALKDAQKHIKSLFKPDDMEVHYQTLDERREYLVKTGNDVVKAYKQDMLQRAQESKQQGDKAGLVRYARQAQMMDKLHEITKSSFNPVNEMARQMIQYRNQMRRYVRQRQQQNQPLAKSEIEIAKNIEKLTGKLIVNKGRLDDIPNEKKLYLEHAQWRVLQRHNLPKRLDKWKAAAQSRDEFSDKEIKSIEKELTKVRDIAAKNFDTKQVPFVDRPLEASDKPQREYMNLVFRPEQMSHSTMTAADIKASQKQFVNDKHVQQAQDVNDRIVELVKASHLEVTGLKKTPDEKVSKIDMALIAKKNCQRLLSLAHSRKKEEVDAFKQISKQLAGQDMMIGKHSRSDKFERQLQKMIDGIDSAQAKLVADPTINNSVNKTDAMKASAAQMSSFKERTQGKLSQYGLDKDKKTNEPPKVKPDGKGNDKQPKPAPDNPYADYLKHEDEERRKMYGQGSNQKSQTIQPQQTQPTQPYYPTQPSNDTTWDR